MANETGGIGGVLAGIGLVIACLALIYPWMSRNRIYAAPVRPGGADSQSEANRRGQQSVDRLAGAFKKLRWVGAALIVVGLAVAFTA